MKQYDSSSILPDGRSYEFWETDPVWERELFVDGSDPVASDDNDGSESAPFRTISRAAQCAEPGTRVRIHAGTYRECVSPAVGGTDPDPGRIPRRGDPPVVLLPSRGRASIPRWV